MLCNRREPTFQRLRFRLCHTGSLEFCFRLTCGACMCCTTVSFIHHASGCNMVLLPCCWLLLGAPIMSPLQCHVHSLRHFLDATHVLRSRPHHVVIMTVEQLIYPLALKSAKSAWICTSYKDVFQQQHALPQVETFHLWHMMQASGVQNSPHRSKTLHNLLLYWGLDFDSSTVQAVRNAREGGHPGTHYNVCVF